MKHSRLFMMFTVILLLILMTVGLYFHGYVRFNYPSKSRYPVCGIDVSHHQGNINWEKVATSDISFVYIKATEGGNFIDPRFTINRAGAKKNEIHFGAYHFFTFCKPGLEQAKNFIKVIASDRGTLPPAVDVEFSGNCKNWTSIESIRKELTIFLEKIEEAFDQKPIIYVNSCSYKKIVAGRITEYLLWVRNILWKPRIDLEDEWILWQYADRSRVEGIIGPVDLNVFSGKKSDFKVFIAPE